MDARFVEGNLAAVHVISGVVRFQAGARGRGRCRQRNHRSSRFQALDNSEKHGEARGPVVTVMAS